MMKQILLLLCLAISVLIQAQDPTLLKITGQSQLTVAPDEAIIFINIEGFGQNTESAHAKATTKLQGLQRVMRALNYPDSLLEVGNLNIQAIRKYDKTQPSGYRAFFQGEVHMTANSLEVTKFIAALGREQLDINSSVQFRLSRSMIKQQEERLIAMAIEDARSKAAIISDQMNMKIVGIKEIQQGQQQNARPFMSRGMEMAMDMAEGVDFDIKPQTLTGSIYIEFLLK